MKKQKNSVFKKKKSKNEVITIPISRILPNPLSVRRVWGEDGLLILAQSIKRYGVIQPLSVRELPSVESKKKKQNNVIYELISGERRLRGAKLAGLSEIPCIVVEADDRHAAELSLAENVGREALGYFEEAAAMAALIDIYGLSAEEAAGVFGISRSALSAKLRLLRLTPREKMLMSASGMSERHAKAIIKICDTEKRLEVIKEAARLYLSAEATEELVDSVLCPKEIKKENRKIGIKDTRIVFNTIDRAIESIEKNGIPVEKERTETKDGVELVLKIKKHNPKPVPVPDFSTKEILIPS